MARTAGTPRGWKRKADRLFSQLIRSRGMCERCGERRPDLLQTAHIISRRYSATRCMPLNALCLCAGCHHYFTDHPLDFADFVNEHLGADRVAELRERARPGVKVDWQVVCQNLQTQLEEAA